MDKVCKKNILHTNNVFLPPILHNKDFIKAKHEQKNIAKSWCRERVKTHGIRFVSNILISIFYSFAVWQEYTDPYK